MVREEKTEEELRARELKGTSSLSALQCRS
jgi:hypothetical protein